MIGRLIIYLFALLAAPATAQQACAPREAVAARLAEEYGEQVVAGGLQNSQRMIEVWASLETGTFTIVMIYASGLSCVVASGTGYFQSSVKDGEPV